jgi:hypothetical protein
VSWPAAIRKVSPPLVMRLRRPLLPNSLPLHLKTLAAARLASRFLMPPIAAAARPQGQAQRGACKTGRSRDRGRRAQWRARPARLAQRWRRSRCDCEPGGPCAPAACAPRSGGAARRGAARAARPPGRPPGRAPAAGVLEQWYGPHHSIGRRARRAAPGVREPAAAPRRSRRRGATIWAYGVLGSMPVRSSGLRALWGAGRPPGLPGCPARGVASAAGAAMRLSASYCYL